jgi:hypothetical protein
MATRPEREAPGAELRNSENQGQQPDNHEEADQEDHPHRAADELEHCVNSLLAPDGVLGFSDAFLDLSLSLIGLAAALRFLVARRLPGLFLGRPDYVLGFALDAVFIQYALS